MRLRQVWVDALTACNHDTSFIDDLPLTEYADDVADQIPSDEEMDESVSTTFDLDSTLHVKGGQRTGVWELSDAEEEDHADEMDDPFSSNAHPLSYCNDSPTEDIDTSLARRRVGHFDDSSDTADDSNMTYHESTESFAWQRPFTDGDISPQDPNKGIVGEAEGVPAQTRMHELDNRAMLGEETNVWAE